MDKIDDILAQPADATMAAKRVTAFLGGGETLAFQTISLGDLVYDRVSIDPQSLEAFDFAHRANVGDIHALACWSHHIISNRPRLTKGASTGFKDTFSKESRLTHCASRGQ